MISDQKLFKLGNLKGYILLSYGETRLVEQRRTYG